jgi:probable F420-dependent oxidoreductase
MRVGVSLHRTGSAPELAELARQLEGEGYDQLQLADHLGDLAPFPALAVAATATASLGVGTLVCNNDFWNPVLLAREAATLALLSDGRFELGIGAGHAQVEYQAAGIPYDRPVVRVARLAETVPLVRRLLDGETVTSVGAHHGVVDAATGLEHPPVPVLVGGNGDRVLELGARHADAVGLTGFTSGTGQRHSDLSHFTWHGLAERVTHVRRAAGDRAQGLELQVLVQLVATGERRRLAEDAARPFDQPAERLLDSPFVMLGSVEDHVEHCARLEELGVTRLTAFEGRGAELLAPVIERLARGEPKARRPM